MLSQNVKDCEQAMAALPKRYYCHLDALDALDKDNGLTLQGIRKKLGRYLIALQEDMTNNPQCNCTVRETVEELTFYLQKLRHAAQKVEYWKLGMNRHYVINQEGALLLYVEYMREKYAEDHSKYPVYDYRMLRKMFRNVWEKID